MFTSTNDCFISSPSSPGVLFNRSHQGSRYHPYGRVSTPYHPSNELETYSFDSNNNNLHNHHSNIQSYDPSGMSYDYSLAWTTTTSSPIDELGIDGQVAHGSLVGGTGRVDFSTMLESRKLLHTFEGTPRCFKRRVSANKKERRRTQSINTAFTDLRTAIPNVQPDTKLSKIKTLKLATKYIEFLMDILAKDDPTAMPSAFKAEIIKTRKDHRDLMKVNSTSAVINRSNLCLFSPSSSIIRYLPGKSKDALGGHKPFGNQN